MRVRYPRKLVRRSQEQKRNQLTHGAQHTVKIPDEGENRPNNGKNMDEEHVRGKPVILDILPR